MKIFSGTTSTELTKKIHEKLQKISGESFNGKLKIDKFLDGETLPIFEESVRNEDVFFLF